MNRNFGVSKLTRVQRIFSLAAILPALVWPVAAGAQHPAKPDRAVATAGARQILQEALKESAAINEQERGILASLAGLQAQAGDVAGAFQTALMIQDEGKRIEAFSLIAVASAKAGDAKTALHAASSIKNEYVQSRVLDDMVREETLGGDVAGAFHTAASVRDELQTARLMATIATAQALTGATDEALSTAVLLDDDRAVDQVRLLVAAKQALSGDLVAARKTIDTVANRERKQLGMMGLTTAQAQWDARTGNPIAALQRVMTLPEGRARTAGLMLIVLAEIQSGDFNSALETAGLMPTEKDADSVRSSVSTAQAKSGASDTARQTAKLIRDEHERASALAQIAAQQARAGDVQGAMHTISTQSSQYLREQMLDAVILAQADNDPDGALNAAQTIRNPMRRDAAVWRIAIVRARRGDVSAVLAQAGKTSAVSKPSPYFRVIGLLQAARELLTPFDRQESTVRDLFPFLVP